VTGSRSCPRGAIPARRTRSLAWNRHNLTTPGIPHSIDTPDMTIKETAVPVAVRPPDASPQMPAARRTSGVVTATAIPAYTSRLSAALDIAYPSAPATTPGQGGRYQAQPGRCRQASWDCPCNWSDTASASTDWYGRRSASDESCPAVIIGECQSVLRT
jgi:hypothetical protein